ncbi:MAG: hypothetical protein GC179_12125 [Anaerolineaceae bacterium]|nr:hypothetical protein [Anaerolineaceae bacterium]
MRKFFTRLIWITLFLPLTLSAMTMSSMRPWILDHSFYEGVVNDDRVYDTLLNDKLADAFNSQILSPVDQLPTEALNSALRSVMTLDYQHAQSMQLVNGIYDFIGGRDSQIDVSIDLKPIKATLSGSAIQRFANTLTATLPVCANGQTPIAVGGTLPRCINSDMTVAAATAQIAHALPTVLENAPNRLTLSDTLGLQQGLRLLDLFLVVTVRSGLDMAIVMVILLTVLGGVSLSYLRGGDLDKNVRWLGKSLVIPAVLFLLAGVILSNDFTVNTLQSIHFISTQALGNLTVLIVQHAGSGLLITGALTGVIALVLVAFTWKPATVEQPLTEMVQFQNN